MQNELLKLKRHIPKTTSHKWLVAFVIVTLLMYLWQQRIFSGWVLLPLFLTFIALDNLLRAYRRTRCLQRIDEMEIQQIFWRQLQQQYPHLDIKQRRLIEQGFKDYLALHALNKQAYAMPSQAVDALWHVMLEHPKDYRKLCKQTVGRVIKHCPYDEKITPEQQTQQRFNTWHVSCMLHDFNLRNVKQLPRLFAIDQALNWENGQHYDVHKMNQDYEQYLKEQAASSSCGGGSCSSCGGD